MGGPSLIVRAHMQPNFRQAFFFLARPVDCLFLLYNFQFSLLSLFPRPLSHFLCLSEILCVYIIWA